MATRWQTDPEFASQLRAAGLIDLDAVFAFSNGQRLDKPSLEGWRQRWRLELPPAQPGRPPRRVYLKRFDAPPLGRQIQRWREGHTGRSTAGVEWHNASLLAAAGIPAAQPIAFGEEMLGPWERRSFLLLDEAPGLSLERWTPNASVLSAQQRRRCVDALARFVARFHAAGFVHRDLYLSHVFLTNPPRPDSNVSDEVRDSSRRVTESTLSEPGRVAPAAGPTRAGSDQVLCAPPELSRTPSGEPDFALIDLQRVFRPRWRRLRWVVKDLAALDYSTPLDCVGPFGRLRFLARYAREFHRWPARRLAGFTTARTARMVRRYAACGFASSDI